MFCGDGWTNVVFSSVVHFDMTFDLRYFISMFIVIIDLTFNLSFEHVPPLPHSHSPNELFLRDWGLCATFALYLLPKCLNIVL